MGVLQAPSIQSVLCRLQPYFNMSSEEVPKFTMFTEEEENVEEEIVEEVSDEVDVMAMVASSVERNLSGNVCDEDEADLIVNSILGSLSSFHDMMVAEERNEEWSSGAFTKS